MAGRARRSAAQVAAQRKASLASAAKRRGRGKFSKHRAGIKRARAAAGVNQLTASRQHRALKGGRVRRTPMHPVTGTTSVRGGVPRGMTSTEARDLAQAASTNWYYTRGPGSPSYGRRH